MKQADAEKTPFRFSLRTLFFVTTITVGAALTLSGRPYSGWAVLFVSIYLFYETRKTSLPELIKKKREARGAIFCGLIFLGLGCYHWWQDDRYVHYLFFCAVFLFLGLAQWIESRSLET